MSESVIRLQRGFSLNEALAILEEDEEFIENVESLTIFPPESATGEETDQDSGDEDLVDINNLPGNQLRAPVEINLRETESKENDGFTSEDDIPLSVLKMQWQRKPKKLPKPNYTWKSTDLDPDNSIFNTQDFQENEPESQPSPLELFSRFIGEDLLDLIVTETNRYSSQKNHQITIEKSEVKAFIGVLLLSGYIQVPRRRMYWEYERDSQNLLVSEAISRNKFEHSLSHIHFADNNGLDARDKFGKVRPLFQVLNQKFLENSMCEEMHCVDEAMVPYFGRHGCKQFIHGKPIRYVYKLWVGATRLGYVVWFEPYQGASTNISEKYIQYGSGPSVVLEYAEVLRKKFPDARIHLFFDNFFSTSPLLEVLSDMNFKATGTLRENRIHKSPLVDSKKMKKEHRGSFDFKRADGKNIIVVKWHDNSIVTLCSNSSGVNPIHSVKRYSQKEKRSIQVTQPHLVNLYNSNMGGVDRCDQNLSLYRIAIRGKKWYFSLITHCIDMAIHNAWQLHKKGGGELDQLKFRRRVATTLLTQNKKSTSSRGHMSRTEGIDIRFDHIDHYVIPQEKQTRCAYCHQRTTTRCQKCNKGLHVKCFVSYHSHPT